MKNERLNEHLIEESDPTSLKLKRRNWILVLLLGLMASGIGSLAFQYLNRTKYQEFESTVGGFLVRTPVKLKEEMQTIDTPAGKLELYMFSGQKNQIGYVVGYMDYPQELASSSPQELLDNARNGAVNNLLGNLQGKLVSETRVSIGGNPGREIVGDAKTSGVDMTLKQRCFLVQNRLFILSVSAQKSTDGIKESDSFLESFRLLSK